MEVFAGEGGVKISDLRVVGETIRTVRRAAHIARDAAVCGGGTAVRGREHEFECAMYDWGRGAGRGFSSGGDVGASAGGVGAMLGFPTSLRI